MTCTCALITRVSATVKPSSTCSRVEEVEDCGRAGWAERRQAAAGHAPSPAPPLSVPWPAPCRRPRLRSHFQQPTTPAPAGAGPPSPDLAQLNELLPPPVVLLLAEAVQRVAVLALLGVGVHHRNGELHRGRGTTRQAHAAERARSRGAAARGPAPTAMQRAPPAPRLHPSRSSQLLRWRRRCAQTCAKWLHPGSSLS